MNRLLYFPAVFLLSSAAMAVEIPRYDVAKYCADPATSLDEYTNGTPEACIANEKQLEQVVAEQWSLYKAEFLEKCIHDPQVKIYSDLATCLANQANPTDDIDVN